MMKRTILRVMITAFCMTGVCRLSSMAAPASHLGSPATSAVLSVDTKMEELEFVRGEELILSGIIRNSGSTVFISDTYGEYLKNSVCVFVRNVTTGRLLTPRQGGGAAKAVTRISVLPGQEKRFSVDLRTLFDLRAQGRYQVTVIVFRGKEEAAMSRSFVFSIVEGVEINSKIYSVRSQERVPLRFSLVFWDRNKEQLLFLRVVNPQHPEEVLGFASLGAMVRVAEPTMDFSSQGLTIVQQTSRDHFERTRFSLDSLPLKLLSREENLLSMDAMQEGVTTRLINQQIQESEKRAKEKKGSGNGFFSRH